MAMVVTIAQQKGGAGKTSLAAHLAAYWAQRAPAAPQEKQRPSGLEGLVAPARVRPFNRVALIDLDPQQSLSAWFRLREELHGPDPNITLHKVEGWRTATELSRLHAEADLIIIDSPPHAETATRVGIRSADIVVVPMQLSPMDIWATRPTVELIEQEQRPALLVFNRVPTRARMAELLADALKREQLPIANSHLGNRIAYSASLMRGRGVTEVVPRSTAAEEIRQLAEEVMAKLSARTH